MSQYQNGTKSLLCKSHKQPHMPSQVVMKHKPCEPKSLLCARVHLVKLTPAQLPANALEQYYKLSVRNSRIKRNHLINDLSASSGNSSSGNLALIQNGEDPTLLQHTKTSPVGPSLFPVVEKSPLQKELSALHLNSDSRPVNGLAVHSYSDVVAQAIDDYFSIQTTKSQVTILPSELADKTLTTPKNCTDVLIPAQNSTETFQVTRSSDPSNEISPTSSSNAQQSVSLASVSLKPCVTVTQPISRPIVRSVASTDTATQSSSTTSQVALTQPQQMLNSIGKKFPSLNVCLAQLPVQTVTNLTKSSMPLHLSLVSNAAATMKNKQSAHFTSSDRHFSGVQLKANHLLDKHGRNKNKTFSNLTLSPVARVFSSVVRVCLSPLRPDQLPPHAQIQYMKLQLGIQGTVKHQENVPGATRKQTQKKSNGKSYAANKKVSHTLTSKSVKDKDSSKLGKKQKVPLQTWKGNLQAAGIQKPKEHFTKNGRVVPIYIESDSDECENQPLILLTKKAKKLTSRAKDSCTKGVKRKADLIGNPRKKLRDSTEPTKEKNKTWVIPKHYRNIKLSQISAISRMKTRYQVAFARWPEIFGGALDVINERIANQNAIWNYL